jgi:hypothetical protein
MLRERMPDGVTRVDRDHDGAPGPYECRPGVRCAERLATLPPPRVVDCDDENAAAFPGAPEVEGDGVDSNCDGVDGWREASPPAVIARPPATP